MRCAGIGTVAGMVATGVGTCQEKPQKRAPDHQGAENHASLGAVLESDKVSYVNLARSSGSMQPPCLRSRTLPRARIRAPPVLHASEASAGPGHVSSAAFLPHPPLSGAPCPSPAPVPVPASTTIDAQPARSLPAARDAPLPDASELSCSKPSPPKMVFTLPPLLADDGSDLAAPR